MRREIKTVGQLAIGRVGFIEARRALLFAACWWITSADLGRTPETVEEYCDWWEMSRRKGFREQASFRACFPEYVTPTELARAVGYDFTSLKVEDKSDVVVEMLGWAAP